MVKSRKIHSCSLCVLMAGLLFPPNFVKAAERTNVVDLLNQAKATYAAGNRDAAVKLASEAIVAEPKSANGYSLRARFHADNRAGAEAVADYDQVLKLDPRNA